MMPKDQYFGVAASFLSPTELYDACEKVRDQGFQKWDAHTPFPVHGLEKAMGLRPSVLPWISVSMAFIGGVSAFTLQWWTAAVDYPVVISGKPLFSWQAFIPVTFEITILLCAFGTVFGMFALNRLPQLYHSLFRWAPFQRVTDDGFFISIEATDPLFDVTKTVQYLKDIGATHVECIEK